MYNSKLPSIDELPSSRQLLRSTVFAAVTACILLVTTVLPAEYGVDPIGIGRILGLTEMGEIKVSLAAEAKREAAGASLGASPTTATAAPAQPPSLVTPSPSMIAQQNAAPVAELPAPPAVAPAPAAGPQPNPAPAQAPTGASSTTILAAAPPRSDEMTIILKPGQGAEIKLEMRKGAKANFSWSSVGGSVNYDTHGDPYNAPKAFYHGYGKGSQVNGDQGVLEAAFDGNHGWFWRNRGSKPVTVILRTNGDYIAIKRVV